MGSIWTRACVLLSGGLALTGCANVTTHVRTRAARDLSCGEAQTRIVDAESGVYRISGCGLEASYHCSESGTTLNMRCERLYLSKAEDSSTPTKTVAGSSLAKTR
jgi:hypothetical protein